MDKKALLVVDVQKGFINRHTKHIPALVENLLPSYRHVIATRFVNPESSNYRRLINWTKFSRGTKDTELAFDAGPNTVVIEKSGYSCVNGDFLKILDALGVEEVHIVGMDTDVCVLKCAADLFDVDRTPVIRAACCASHAGPEFHASAIRIISRFIGAGQIIE
jgi:nicotinamidase-related amidase